MKTVQNLVSEELMERIRSTGTVVEMVSPNLLDSYRPQDSQAIITIDSVTANNALSCQGNPPAQAFDVSYKITAVVRQSSSESINIEERLNSLTGDILAGVSSPSTWWTFGGNAINSRFLAMTKSIDSDGSIMMNEIDLLVTYRTDETNPYVRR